MQHFQHKVNGMSGSTIIPWVVGNWKMNPMRANATPLVHQIIDLFASSDFDQQACQVAVAPTFIALDGVKAALEDAAAPLHVVAQDVSRFAATGAYTGEISAELLQDSQIHYVLIGHSERRELLGDSPQVLNAKLQHALHAGMTVIYCVGESLEQREQGIAEQVVLQQICDIAPVLTPEQWSKQILIAYEPIWAIGTGKTASAQDAQAMHASIRSGLKQLTQYADQIALLYGGSVKPDNAVELAACLDINGVLVGGASLNAQSFYQIAQAFAQPQL